MNTHNLLQTYLAHCGGVHLDDRAMLHLAMLAAGSLLVLGVACLTDTQCPSVTDKQRQEPS